MSFNFGNYGLSSLFGGGSSGGFYGSLGNYGSIRSGSYKKLLTSYYAKTRAADSSASNRKTNTRRDDWNPTYTYSNRSLTAVRKEADELTASARALTNQGSKSLFTEKYTTTTDAETGVKTTTKGYDREAISEAVDAFVSDYNSAVKAGMQSTSTNVNRNTSYMTKQTAIYARSLAEVGITVGKDQTLSVDKDKLKDADIDSLKRVFNGPSSFASLTASRSSSISQSAVRAASTSSTYNRVGSYNNYYGNYLGSYNWYF